MLDRASNAAPTSILGEAIAAGASRLAAAVHSEMGKPLEVASQGVAASLGFGTWSELSQHALGATTRRVDARLRPLIGVESDAQLASRLAGAMGGQPERMAAAVQKFRQGVLPA